MLEIKVENFVLVDLSALRLKQNLNKFLDFNIYFSIFLFFSFTYNFYTIHQDGS